MAFRTFGDLNSQLKKELDLEGEEFIAPDEMMGLWNHAVSEAEAHIITLGLKDKYFLARTLLSTVQGQEEIDLPTDLYANKIIRLMYQLSTTTIYEIKRLASSSMFRDYADLNVGSTTDYYRYFITHTTPGVEKIVIVPKARETASNVITAWYYRDAARYTDDADVCDMPEVAYEFLHSRVKELCYEKESLGAQTDKVQAAREERKEKELFMQSILSGQTNEPEISKMEQDLSFYEEST